MQRRYLPYFLLALAVFLLDQATKYFIMHHLNLYQVVKILPSFNIVYYRNIGSAFGMFKSLGNAFFIVVSLGAIMAVSVFIVKDADSRLAFSLILAGAAGNLADRIIHGYVVDFLEVYAGSFYWPAFNVADSALTVGIALLIIRTAFGRK
ncbi:MAG: signal peptidase II [Nitrospiraceae bacterium]|nr:signal peptidase II [Nitrospiraceae bacterium]MDA8433137.1 signal peptidase II [Nitrospiraceae bacterium]